MRQGIEMRGAIIIAGARLPIWAVVGTFVVGALVGVAFGQGTRTARVRRDIPTGIVCREVIPSPPGITL